MAPHRNRKELWLTTQELQYVEYASKFFGTDKTTTIRILMRLGVYQVLKQTAEIPHNKHSEELQNIVDDMKL